MLISKYSYLFRFHSNHDLTQERIYDKDRDDSNHNEDRVNHIYSEEDIEEQKYGHRSISERYDIYLSNF